MKRKIVLSVLSMALGMTGIATAATQAEPNRTILPIHEPQIPHSTVLDARNATPPPASK
jgi:arylsulfatase